MMIHSIKKTACALTILAASISHALAESIDVKVIGTITPAACKPTLTGNGTVDYGVIPLALLKKDAINYLDEKQLDFSLLCDAPAKVAIVAKTARLGSAVNPKDGSLTDIASHVKIFGNINVAAVGLGLVNNKGIGGYGIRLKAGTMVADGKNVDSIQRNGSETSWSKTKIGSLLNNSVNVRQSSWATSGSLEPLAFTTLSGKLGVQAYINKASELDLSKPVKLDGLTTLELVYL